MSQDENLKQISERCVKQDPTFKIMLNPKQLLIGNYSLKLKALKPLIFEQNSNRRICMRFYVEGNPKVGYNDQDIGIALTQFDSITVKDEERENPAVLTCSLKPTSMTKFYKMLTGVQEIVEKPFPHRKNLTRNFTFTLHPFQKNTENYSKVSFGALDTFREFQLDFEAVKKILLQDLHGVWNEMLRDQAARRPNISIGHTHKLMAEMDSSSWIQYIQDQKLQKQLGPDGSVIYTSMPETPGGRILHTGSKEYAGNAKRLQPFIDFEQNEKRKKMKVVPSHIKKLIELPPTSNRIAERHLFVKLDEELTAGQNTDNNCYLRIYNEETINRVKVCQKAPICGDDEFFRNRELREQRVEKKRGKVLSEPFTSNGFHDTREHLEEIEKRMCQLATAEIQSFPSISSAQPIQHHYQFEEMVCTDVENYQRQQPPQLQRTNGVANLQYNAIIQPQKMHDILMDEHEMAEFLQLQNQPQPQQPQQPIFDYRQQGDFAYTNTNVKLAQQPQQSLKKFEVASSSSESPTPSSRKASSAQQAAKLENESSWVSSETQLFSFPPRELVLQGIDPVAFMVRDVRTLDRKEFVNDNVMAFMLNYIAVNMIDKELMNKIHLCNTFFYSNLTRSLPTLCFSRRKPIEAEHNVTLVENCSRVLRWTKKFDVFSKDYIVIPVNEDYHWLLITVFNPAGAIVNLSSEDESRKAPMCYVAFFDPLSGLDPTKKNHMCYCVKTYLAELYDKTKTAGKRFASADNTAFDPDRVIITNPKNLPIQSNFYDCGLYTLHFIEGLFCYLNRPVTVKDFPNFDWSALYPAANEMADLMRDKIYNLVLKVSDQRAKQRLSRYEKNQSTGLSQEGNLRKGRRHSADRVRKTPRHGEYRQRRYSVNPPSRAVMEDPMFLNPRAMVEMPATRRVRALRLPEENFPVIY